MIKPSKLQKGNTVGIVAPGRKIEQKEVEAAIMILQTWGVNVVLGKNIFSTQHSYLSGTDEERLDDFQKMVDDKSINAIICARGGYGSTRILDDVNFSSFKTNPKWIVGFSDITAFHLKLLSLGYQSIHGTMPILFSKAESSTSVESLRKVLFGKDVIISTNSNIFNRFGSSSGQVVGGNLSLLVDSLATKSEPDIKGKILILEEIDEYLYRIDRMMTQLKRTGKLAELSGLIIGHFTDIKDTETGFGEEIEEIILNVVKEYKYPVAFGFPIGHENPNISWLHGGVATLTVNQEESKLIYDATLIE